MPIEFSVAAFRLGHSMIRRAYNWNKNFDDGSGTLDCCSSSRRPAATWAASSGCRATGSRTSAGSTTSTRPNKPNLAVPAAKFNRAMRIDTTLVNPLKNLPPASFGGPNVPFNDRGANLAFRNLTRARMVKLATGQQMATFLKGKGVNLTKLTKTQIRDGNNGARARQPHPDPARGVPQGHAAVVLHPARGRAERRQAEGGRRAHRRGDDPPRDGGQPALDRPRPHLEARRSAPTTAPSAWSTCCSSPSRERRTCWLRSDSYAVAASAGTGAGCVIRMLLPNGSRMAQSMP